MTAKPIRLSLLYTRDLKRLRELGLGRGKFLVAHPLNIPAEPVHFGKVEAITGLLGELKRLFECLLRLACSATLSQTSAAFVSREETNNADPLACHSPRPR